jgi:hypothetical protein
MKKKLAVLLVLMMVFVFSGCMRTSIDLDIHEDGTADFSMLYAMMTDMDSMMDDLDLGDDVDLGDDSDWSSDDDFDWSDEDFSEDLGEDLSEDVAEEEQSLELSPEEIAELEADGFTYEVYEQDGYKGYIIKGENKPLEEIFSETGATGIDENEFVITKNGSSYVIEWTVFDEEEDSEVGEIAEYFEPYGGYMQFVLTLPEPAGENNATEVSEDGKTLTWNLLTLNGENVHVEFELPQASSGGGSGAIIAIIVAVLAVIVVAVLISRKKKAATIAPAAAPAETPEAPAETENNNQ